MNISRTSSMEAPRQTNNGAYPVLDGSIVSAAAVPRLDEGCVLDRDGRDSHCGGMMLNGRQLKIESASKELHRAEVWG